MLLLVYEPQVPFQVDYLLDIFFELNSARSGGGFGAGPLTFPDIKAWSELTNFPLSYWEVRVLKRLDSTYLSFQSKKAKQRTKKSK